MTEQDHRDEEQHEAERTIRQFRKMSGRKHIVKSFDDELKQVHYMIQEMGAMCVEQACQSVRSVVDRDDDLAEIVIKGDNNVDDYAADIHELTFSMLSLRQPTSIDLRSIIVARKTATDLERIADYASNIAKRALMLNRLPAIEARNSIPRMSKMTHDLLRKVLQAYQTHNLNLAIEVWYGDKEVDEVYNSLLREFITYMLEDPRNITACIHLLFIIRNIERVGDHTVNIAEALQFLITGQMPSDKRPKTRQWREIDEKIDSDKADGQ